MGWQITFGEMVLASALLAVLAALASALLLDRAGFPLPIQASRFGNIDGLRGFLALSVMIHHYRLWTIVSTQGGGWGTGAGDAFNNFGAGAVSLFFAITGLVFYKRVLAGLTNTDWIGVYVSRAARILPAVVASVMIVTVVTALKFGIKGTAASNVKSLLIWLSAWNEPALFGNTEASRINAAVFWSLRIEWIFYLFLLPTLATFRQLTRPFAKSWIVPTLLLAVSVFMEIAVPSVAYWPRFGVLFAVGMFAYELRTRTDLKVLRSRGVALLSLLILAATAALIASPYGFPAVIAYAVFFFIVSHGNDLFGLLSTRAALILGEISFSIYLLHAIVLYVLFVWGLPAFFPNASAVAMLCLIPFATFAVVMISAWSFLLIEKPFIEIGRAFLARRRPLDREPFVAAEVAP